MENCGLYFITVQYIDFKNTPERGLIEDMKSKLFSTMHYNILHKIMEWSRTSETTLSSRCRLP